MRLAKVLLVVALVPALAIAATGCSSNKGVAARVNGQKIMLADLNKQVDQLQKQYPTMFSGTDGEGRLLDYKSRILDNLINQVLVEQGAKDMGINVTDADVEAQVKTLKSQFKDAAQFEQALKTAGMDEAGLTDTVRQQLLTQKLIAKLSEDLKKPTADEIKAYYESNKAQFQTAAATRASHIVFASSDKATAEKALAKIKAGADFATIAKQSSIDTATASKGGDLGWPTTPYLAEFEAALKKLKVGQVSPLVKTANGWEIIKATATRKASTQTLEEATSTIEQILLQQQKSDAYQKYVAELRSKAQIEILVSELQTPQSSTTTTSTE
jgi:foldase protein PrsA